MQRPTWDEYFLNILDAVSQRATCDRGKSGCVITLDNRILSTGYVGSPAGLPSCDEVGHLLREVKYENGEVKQHCVRTIHAEQNAIVYAARYGVSLLGATLYCSMVPCQACCMLIIASGIKRVVAKNDYQSSSNTKEMFKQADIELVVINNDVLSYKK
ncbi:MAG: cytidine/deoxycytidylate deaminase family protein [Alphaproteobacteria bacterium]|jgi:dCMP deaminase|nr:cytidine/deoxycytidylate deaminase family protein [Alphaproteobacteria bacterium]